MIRALIVDDEIKGAETLRLLLKAHCPEVQVLDVANSADEAIKKITNLTPDLVFLDISMPYVDGFSLLDKLGTINFEIIFVTAHSEYAIKAFKRNAIDYLLKPIKPMELINSVKNCEKKLSQSAHVQKLQNQVFFFKEALTIHKIAIHNRSEIVLVDTEDIIRFEADRNYSLIYLMNGKKIMSTKPLADYEKSVPEEIFIRIHKKNLINRMHINTFKKGERLIIMVDGSALEVSRLKSPVVLAALTN
jgi:two-component system, LytTR family, response regulator